MEFYEEIKRIDTFASYSCIISKDWQDSLLPEFSHVSMCMTPLLGDRCYFEGFFRDIGGLRGDLPVGVPGFEESG